MQDVTYPVSLPSCYCTWDISFLFDYTQYFFISHMIGPAEFFHLFPASHFKSWRVFLI